VSCGLLEFVYCYGCMNCLEISVGRGYALCRCEQWRTLIVSPRRARLAQARCAGARPGFSARVVAQATRVCFERADNSPRREGSRLSEIPHCFLTPFEPSLRRRRTCLSEIVSPERDPSAWARCWARQCCVFGCLLFLDGFFWLGMNV